MDWKAKVGQDVERKIQDNWPRIQELFREKAGPAVLAAIHDDEKMTAVLKLVHEALPFPLRLLVKQDAFVQFCLARREHLAGKAAATGQ